MDGQTDRLIGSILTMEDDLERDFEARVSESVPLAFRVAFSVVKHREDAEDIAQEAFARAHRSFRQLRDRDRFRAWLVRITWRLALNRQRNDRRRMSRELFLVADTAQSGVATAEERERATQLWQAIDVLPPKLRLVTILAGIEGHDLREVALLLGVPEGTVKSRLFLARQRLKELLQWTRTEPSTP
jgi:RNA polymerase sigma-70 factor (ECF subfamily)